MNQKSEEGLFQILEKELKASKQPMDCIELYNKSMAIREHATSPNRVSDYLGNMWRKGLLVRLPAPRGEGSKARWLYAWKAREKTKPDMREAIAYDATVHTILNKPHCQIEDDGKRITIHTRYLTLTIEQKEDE